MLKINPAGSPGQSPIQKPKQVTRKTNIKAAVLALVVGFSSFGAVPGGEHTYSSGFPSTEKIAGDLCELLDPKFASRIGDHPLFLQPQDTPVIAPVVLTDEGKSQAEVCLSAGFIDLINHIAHAKAIDKIQPGFFNTYVQNLGHLHGQGFVLPDMVDARYWTDDVMDSQVSFFNQMVSILMAINLSHHYLGHYTKYAAQLANPENKLVPINQVLSPEEWNVSLKTGVHNSLDSGLATEGLSALFDAIDKMPQRPSWTIFVVPPFVDLKKTNKQLAAWEYDFFHGGKNL